VAGEALSCRNNVGVAGVSVKVAAAGSLLFPLATVGVNVEKLRLAALGLTVVFSEDVTAENESD
jgi:hypothetical protein